MYPLEKYKKYITKQVNEALGGKYIQASDLVFPPQADFGDLSLPCFQLAKQAKKSPAEIAGVLLRKIENKDIIAGVKIVGPYVNFIFNKNKLIKDVLGQIDEEKGKYGFSDKGKGKRIMIEYSNANTHKEYHVGHLRNLCFGDSVNRILSANGYKSIPVSYINDFGIHTAKTLWAYLKFYDQEELPENKGYFLGQVYVRSTSELDKNPNNKEEVGEIMKKIENRQGEEYELWKKTREWSIEQFAKIYKELGVKFDHTFYENEFIEKGKDIVGELYEKRILKKSDGAIIADLEKYDLGILVLMRSDGTALYPVADLPLATHKIEKYKLDKSVYVVDVRQSLYFKQLFKLLELMGYKQEFVHLGYDFVKLPSGMMSSRSGNVITYEDLKMKMRERTEDETGERHEEWSEEKIEKVANTIANGAIKFEMLKVSANQVITFDVEKALRFEGYTAAYLQYTYARIKSIIRKAENEIEKFENNPEKLSEPKEYELVMKLAKYSEVVERAGKEYNPSEIAKYLFELAQLFNDYYHCVPVLKSEDEIRQARLFLLLDISQVIANGLDLLGIEVLEEM